MSEKAEQNDAQKRSKPSGKLAEIFARMNMSEIPAMASNVQELISLTQSSRSAAYELSKVILKDYSLTNKVLQVVNSAYYSIGRPVNSISRAVTILGFDAVRDLATAIALFEEFIKSGVEKEGISKLLTTSFLSALQARDLAVEKRMQVAPEEAFICTLLHKLGKIIVCIHAPEFYNEIEELIENGMTEDAASLKVLNDADYRMVGEEVAKFWNLSEKAILSMSTMPKKPEGPYDTDTYLQNLANFTNTLVSSICNQSDLDPLIKKYGEMMSLDKQEAINMVYKCVEASEDISDSIRYGLSKLKIRSRIARLEREIKDPSLARKRKEKNKKAKRKAAQEQKTIAREEQTSEELEEELDELPISKDKSVNDFIREITETLMGNFNLNDFYVHLLEGLYQGIGFDKVILAILSIQGKKLSLIGRFGLGEIDPAEVSGFYHELDNSDYAITRSLKGCKDMAIRDNTPGAFRDEMMPIVKNRTVYLFPICIGNQPIGLIYLDRKAGRPRLDRTNIKNVRLFRDFAVMAIRKMQGRK